MLSRRKVQCSQPLASRDSCLAWRRETDSKSGSAAAYCGTSGSLVSLWAFPGEEGTEWGCSPHPAGSGRAHWVLPVIAAPAHSVQAPDGHLLAGCSLSGPRQLARLLTSLPLQTAGAQGHPGASLSSREARSPARWWPLLPPALPWAPSSWPCAALSPSTPRPRPRTPAPLGSASGAGGVAGGAGVPAAPPTPPHPQILQGLVAESEQMQSLCRQARVPRAQASRRGAGDWPAVSCPSAPTPSLAPPQAACLKCLPSAAHPRPGQQSWAVHSHVPPSRLLKAQGLAPAAGGVKSNLRPTPPSDTLGPSSQRPHGCKAEDTAATPHPGVCPPPRPSSPSCRRAHTAAGSHFPGPGEESVEKRRASQDRST